jgi:putative nucleotidyltransferase with HDIG domain
MAEEAYLGPRVRALLVSLERKDRSTERHTRRVALLAVRVGEQLRLPPATLRHLAVGALLHDIGKLSVPDAVLKKPGPLTDSEWSLMRTHPEAGAKILDAVPFLDRAVDVVLHHHERWDGRGYPGGLEEEGIPLWARIFSVADTVDAITSDRPYRQGRPLEQAVREIVARSGSQFDPDCAHALEDLDHGAVREVVAARE